MQESSLIKMNQNLTSNPYNDPVKREFWEICVRRDLEAFLAQDWAITAADFYEPDFLGIDAAGNADPASWTPKFHSLESYRKEFEVQASDFATKSFDIDVRQSLYQLLRLSEPVIKGDRALIVKLFDGKLTEKDGSILEMKWQSIFHFKRINERWLITGFVGYLPY